MAIGDPIPSIIFKNLDFKLSPFINGRDMKESGIAISHSKPICTGFLVPQKFFLEQGRIKLLNKVLFKNLKIMRKMVILGFLNALNACKKTFLSFKNISKNLLVPDFNRMGEIIDGFKQVKIHVKPRLFNNISEIVMTKPSSSKTKRSILRAGGVHTLSVDY